MIPAADAHMAMEVLAMAETAKVLLVRTNICSLNEAWLKPFLENGGVEGGCGMVKALAASKCVGLEFGGAGCAEALRGVASSGGFALIDSPDNYAEWRYMGVEG
jgi:protein XRP2